MDHVVMLAQALVDGSVMAILRRVVPAWPGTVELLPAYQDSRSVTPVEAEQPVKVQHWKAVRVSYVV